MICQEFKETNLPKKSIWARGAGRNVFRGWAQAGSGIR
jgi:hypothetical protein